MQRRLHLKDQRQPDGDLRSPRSNDTNNGAGGSGGEEEDGGGAFADSMNIVKSVVGEVKQRIKVRKERDRALSTVTHIPDDVAWRKEEVFEGSEDEWSEGVVSDGEGRAASPKQGKRWSAEPAAVSTSAPLVRRASPGATFPCLRVPGLLRRGSGACVALKASAARCMRTA